PGAESGRGGARLRRAREGAAHLGRRAARRGDRGAEGHLAVHARAAARRAAAEPGALAGELPGAQGRRQLPRPLGEAGRGRGQLAVRAALLQRRGAAVRDAHRVVPRRHHGESVPLPADAVLRDRRPPAGDGGTVRLLALLCALWAMPVPAAERVVDFHSSIAIAADGVLTVTERIVVEVEGRNIQRGILRDFPTDYRDRFGNRVSVPFEVLRVRRDGAPENFELERLGNGERIRIGRGYVMLQNGQH